MTRILAIDLGKFKSVACPYGSKTQLNEESHRLLGLTSQFEHRIVAGVVDPKM